MLKDIGGGVFVNPLLVIGVYPDADHVDRVEILMQADTGVLSIPILLKGDVDADEAAQAYGEAVVEAQVDARNELIDALTGQPEPEDEEYEEEDEIPEGN